MGNTLAGVYIDGSSSNTVGGTTGVSSSECSGACNLISGNKTGVVLKGSGTVTNTVLGNFIGTDRTGTAALGNKSYGVVVDAAPNNRIGGASSGARNLVSGNGTPGASGEGDGIVIGDAAATGNLVVGNYIGTKASGTEALANVGNGVRIDTAPNNTVGDSGGANVLAGNLGNGVRIGGTGATGNTVRANFIGIDSSGTAALPNAGAGVLISGAPNNTVGGATAGLSNVLSGNRGSGVKISGDGASGNVVIGNSVGTDRNGTLALPNAADGVLLGEGASGTQVGGSGEGEGNVISGNGSDGVEINGLGAASNAVQGNYIGTLRDGLTRMGNTGHGVYVAGGAGGNIVGGVITSTANTVAFNGGDGVYVASGVGNMVRGNAIQGNGGLGIDLATNGVTPNDQGDGDSGVNNLLNFPVLTSLVISGGVATIQGTLNGTANMAYTLGFFANVACDPSLHGEGQRFLGTITATTDVAGNAGFTFMPSATLSDTERVAATTTDAVGNTSEFSKCARPTERVSVGPATGHTQVFTSTQGNATTVEIPGAAITYTQAITLAYAPMEDVAAPGGFVFAGRAFELSAYLGDTPLTGLGFSKPVTVTIRYSDTSVAGLDEEQLTLLYWNGSAWSSDGISLVERNAAGNYAVFAIAHLSDFALFAPTFKTYLPAAMKSYGSGW